MVAAPADVLTDELEPTAELPIDAVAVMSIAARAAPAWASLEPVRLDGFVTVSEREAGPWICCAPCSAAMVVAWAGLGPATLEAAHAIRTAAGYPHKGGTSPRRIGIAAGLTMLERDRALIDDRLAAGWAITAAIDASQLPPELKRFIPGFGGGHDVALAGRAHDGRWGYWDPAAPADELGVYADPADVLRASWSTVGGLWGLPGSEVPMAPIYVVPADSPPASDVTVRKGAAIYDAPGHRLPGASGTVNAPRTVPGYFRTDAYVAVGWPTSAGSGTRLLYLAEAEVTIVPRPVVDCSAAIAADRASARITYPEVPR